MKLSSLKRVDIVTLFPAMFEGPMSQSLLGRARANHLIDVRIHNLRDYSTDDKHHKVDDRPYGGGAGMVLQAEPIHLAIKAVRASGKKNGKPYVIYLSPQGRVLNQAAAAALVKKPWLVLVCGHYEGIDERAMSLIDEEISVGDYVLTGGELPAMVLADVVLRLVPGVVKESDSIANDSFQKRLLDHPHYTRPATWRKHEVPAVLLSGNHQKIEAWRAEQARAATKKKRPDLLKAKH
jgi:tRNA (guanine37-N1)-methyltransferase